MVSVPAELVLGADANSNAILTKKDIVSKSGASNLHGAGASNLQDNT